VQVYSRSEVGLNGVYHDKASPIRSNCIIEKCNVREVDRASIFSTILSLIVRAIQREKTGGVSAKAIESGTNTFGEGILASHVKHIDWRNPLNAAAAPNAVRKISAERKSQKALSGSRIA
jgi:hypothetical protein